MLLRQYLKTGTYVLELVNFMQDRLKRHAYTDFPLQCLRGENFRWTGLGQKT
jgi:hypothetical protein